MSEVLGGGSFGFVNHPEIHLESFPLSKNPSPPIFETMCSLNTEQPHKNQEDEQGLEHPLSAAADSNIEMK